jgi:hypothetical protein
MEEAEKEAPQKAKDLISKYQDQFNDITYTLHPVGRPGEIRGKSSNVAWASREMVRQCGGPRVEEIFTVMDADTCFAQDYFESLSYHYSVASSHERPLLFFCPTNVFDRYVSLIVETQIKYHGLYVVVTCLGRLRSFPICIRTHPSNFLCPHTPCP